MGTARGRREKTEGRSLTVVVGMGTVAPVLGGRVEWVSPVCLEGDLLSQSCFVFRLLVVEVESISSRKTFSQETGPRTRGSMTGAVGRVGSSLPRTDLK